MSEPRKKMTAAWILQRASLAGSLSDYAEFPSSETDRIAAIKTLARDVRLLALALLSERKKAKP